MKGGRPSSFILHPSSFFRAHELLPNRAQNPRIRRHSQIDELLPVAIAVEGDDESIDAERDGASEVFVFGGEVVFAEVADRVEEFAVAHVEIAISSEDAS